MEPSEEAPTEATPGPSAGADGDLRESNGGRRSKALATTLSFLIGRQVIIQEENTGHHRALALYRPWMAGCSR